MVNKNNSELFNYMKRMKFKYGWSMYKMYCRDNGLKESNYKSVESWLEL